jgi:hypothetical protein
MVVLKKSIAKNTVVLKKKYSKKYFIQYILYYLFSSFGDCGQ